MRSCCVAYIKRIQQEVWRKIAARNDGTFTIEASLVMPVVLLSTVGFLLLALLVYRQGAMYSQAALIADRMAYVWDNSHKDPISGSFAIAARDGLYWRLTQDHAFGLNALFADEPSVTVELPTEIPQSQYNLAKQKLSRAADLLPSGQPVRLSYSKKLLIRSIGVELNAPTRSPTLAELLDFPETIGEAAKSNVVDPVEFIRTIDFARSYAAQLLDSLPSGEAGELLGRTASLSPSDALKFNGHDIDVVPYLQQLVNGRPEEYPSNYGVRHIDALDKSGVAHQAFCTYNSRNLADVQLPKDADLLKKGAVKGVVWHFFTNCRGTQSKPSQRLLQKLRDMGIVAAIHN
jgi:hypothetical protein